ncbi:hypothetical protein [Parendozoicomonas sp. Alg238-R29]|uniref:hypothetical protein n=1 Tax=Parendozoicomonas sp. Alg238-R29 TaxID=2993446 RepID=UPI00248D8051|nr:hypothetical protein [Parendozoicomonas sp. Alg238-R29]
MVTDSEGDTVPALIGQQKALIVAGINEADVPYEQRLKFSMPLFLLAGLALFFGYIGSTMGVTNMFNTIFSTAHDLLLNTVFYIIGITVIAGAFSRLLVEFGLIAVLEKVLAPLMRPVFNLPGRGSLAGLMTFFLITLRLSAWLMTPALVAVLNVLSWFLSLTSAQHLAWG